MQDLESLRSIALECDIRGSLVVELIDRLQAAEKDRDDWKLHAERQAADATARMIQAMENGAAANALRDELKALREQKPAKWAWKMPDGKFGKSLYESKELAISSCGKFIVGFPAPIYADVAVPESAPIDSGIAELDCLCEKYNNREIDIVSLVSRVWNTAISAAPVAQSRDSAEPVLDKPARVNAGVFHAGIKHRTVVEAAQRYYEYMVENPLPVDRSLFDKIFEKVEAKQAVPGSGI